MQGWIIRIAIVAVIVIGGLIFRDRLSGSAGDLKVGDCFDDPQGVTTVKDVQHHPCNEAHTSEVVFVGNVPGENSAYPGETGFVQWAISNCAPAFATYTGVNLTSQDVLDLSYFFPLESGWSKGDRTVTCYAFRLDQKPVTSSFKKAP